MPKENNNKKNSNAKGVQKKTQNYKAREEFSYKSQNMNYIYYKEYYDGIFDRDLSDEEQEKEFAKRNNELIRHNFTYPVEGVKELKQSGLADTFSLTTMYPGLLMGTGNPHDAKEKGAISGGFSFDFVTGTPYITGSSLKGMLRSYFPSQKKLKELKKETTIFIQECIGRELDVLSLEKALFEGENVFVGVYPVSNGRNQYMALDHITPHKSKLENPTPITILKVKPEVDFEFIFMLHDVKLEDGTVFTKKETLELFKTLIELGGVGAKTNVGFSQFGSEN